MAEAYPENAEGWAKRSFDHWMTLSGAERADKLLRWLQNNDEAASWGDEPFRWILKSVPAGTGEAESKTALAEAVAAILQRRPDERLRCDFPEQILHNLFLLAASLHRPSQLWQPLLSVLDRQLLSGAYLGSDLRSGFLSALVSNQADDSLIDIWRNLARGKGDGFLTATPVDAFYGTLLLPPDENTSDRNGEALADAARFMDSDHNYRRPRFMTLIEATKRAFPKPDSNWDVDLVYMADKNSWPVWTRSCFNTFVSFNQSAERQEAEGEEYVMPSPVAQGITTAFGTKESESLLSGALRTLPLHNGSLEYYQEFSSAFRSGLRKMIYVSDGAWEGLFNQTVLESDTWLQRIVGSEGAASRAKEAMLEAFHAEASPLHEDYAHS